MCLHSRPPTPGTTRRASEHRSSSSRGRTTRPRPQSLPRAEAPSSAIGLGSRPSSASHWVRARRANETERWSGRAPRSSPVPHPQGAREGRARSVPKGRRGRPTSCDQSRRVRALCLPRGGLSRRDRNSGAHQARERTPVRCERFAPKGRRRRWPIRRKSVCPRPSPGTSARTRSARDPSVRTSRGAPSGLRARTHRAFASDRGAALAARSLCRHWRRRRLADRDWVVSSRRAQRSRDLLAFRRPVKCRVHGA